MPWINMVYEYDDSYEGFLCCVYESYVNKEFPIAFFSNEEFSVLTLYPVRCVKTDLTHMKPAFRYIRLSVIYPVSWRSSEALCDFPTLVAY